MKRIAFFLAAASVALAPLVEAKTKHGKPKPRAFDYYVLSLSWAPEYCKSHPGDTQECGTNRPGFVLHGLWPQYRGGGYPQSCSVSAKLDADARAFGGTVFPSEKLMEHEWAKHGTCSGLNARQYFEAADSAHRSVTIPGQFEPGMQSQRMTVDAIATAFRGVNQSIPAKGLAVACAGSDLSEVLVCLSKDLTPIPCGRDVHNDCRAATINVIGVR